ncbi:MAG: hypothetical protein GY927_04205 [bacterium]|nr:hypothetical protein [bacterium]
MGDFFFYIAAFIFVIALIVLGAWLWRSMLERGVNLPGNGLFKATSEKRIGTIETTSIDSRRKLVLLRRDGVEHLIMTGGPVDVVIETGIERSATRHTSSSSYGSDQSQSARSYGGSSLEKRLASARDPEIDSPRRAND